MGVGSCGKHLLKSQETSRHRSKISKNQGPVFIEFIDCLFASQPKINYGKVGQRRCMGSPQLRIIKGPRISAAKQGAC